MDREEIIRIAREADLPLRNIRRDIAEAFAVPCREPIGVEAVTFDELHHFAELVAAPLLQRIAELTGAQLPTAEDIESQNWERVDGAIAWHLVYRYAEDWAHTARLMHAWRDAAVAEAIRARGATDGKPT